MHLSPKPKKLCKFDNKLVLKKPKKNKEIKLALQKLALEEKKLDREAYINNIFVTELSY